LLYHHHGTCHLSVAASLIPSRQPPSQLRSNFTCVPIVDGITLKRLAFDSYALHGLWSGPFLCLKLVHPTRAPWCCFCEYLMCYLVACCVGATLSPSYDTCLLVDLGELTISWVAWLGGCGLNASLFLNYSRMTQLSRTTFSQSLV
jgi:hypothetical protein